MTIDHALSASFADKAASRVRWRIFLVMLFLIAINYIDRASLSVAMPLIAKEFDIGPATQGLILSSFFWTYAFMQIPGGMLADRFKPRIVIAGATLGLGLLPGDRGGLHQLGGLLLTRLGLGAAEAPIYPAGGKLNAIWMTQNERGRGATLLDGGAPLGAALGAIIIAGLIADSVRGALAFVVAGIGTVLARPLRLVLHPQHPREHPGVNDAEASYIEAAHAAEDARTEPAAQRPRARLLPVPLGLGHVLRLDVLQQRCSTAC